MKCTIKLDGSMIGKIIPGDLKSQKNGNICPAILKS